MSRNQIVDAARAYKGTPFLHQGRAVAGLDCVGLCIRVAHDLDLTQFDIDGYSRVPSGRMMQRVLAEQCERIQIEDAQPGDLLHLAFEDEPQHMAIVTDRGIIHCNGARGVVEHRLDSQWRYKIRGAYRLPGVESCS